MDQTSLRVCLLNDSFPPVIDGVSNTIANYARIIQRDLGQVIVGTPQYPNVVDDYPFPVVRYPSIDTTRLVGYRAGYPFSVQSLAALCSFQPDIIHSHCPAMSNLVARTLREQLDVPMVFTYHTKFDVDIAKAMESRLLQTASIRMLVSNIEASDEVWVVSRGAGENLKSLGYKGDYVVMNNGVDCPRGPVEPDQCARLRQELGISREETVYLFVGRMMWYKGVRIILEALAQGLRENAGFRLVMVGDGTDLPEIKEEAARLGLKDRILFTGAVRDRSLLRVYFSMADLFLFPSSYDTNGIVVREAAACALGSILIRGSCAAEDIEDGRNGILIEENSQSMWAALRGLSRAAMHQVGEHALQEIYISWDDSVRLAYARYQVILDRYRSGHTERHFEISDDFFTLMNDLCRSIGYARNVREKGMKKLERFRNWWEE